MRLPLFAPPKASMEPPTIGGFVDVSPFPREVFSGSMLVFNGFQGCITNLSFLL